MKTSKLGLVLIMGALSLSACSSETKPTPGDASSSPQASSPSASAAQQKEKLKLNWFVNGPNNSILPSKDQDFVKKVIEEKFNVDLSIEHMQVGDEATTKLNLKLASGQAPDMFMAEGRASQKYIIDGVVQDLTKIMTPETMPNYYKYWTNPEELKRFQVENVFKRALVPYSSRGYISSYYIRKDWLDKLNLKMPETYDEMIKVMEAFTFQDPDGNGKNDTYGLTEAGGGASVPQFPEFYKHGLYSNLMLENNELIDAYTDTRIQQVFEDLLVTINKGIIDKDWFLQKGEEAFNKAVQGRVGIINSWNKNEAFDNNVNGLQYKSKEVLKKAGQEEAAKKVDWQPIHPWAKTGVQVEALPGHLIMFGLNTSPEKVKRSVEILDWLASEEGFLLTRFGKEGVHYKKNGKQIVIDPDAFKKDVTDQGNFLSIYSFFSNGDPDKLGLLITAPNETDRDRLITQKLATYVIKPSVGTSLAPPAGLDIGAFRKEMRAYHAKMLFDDKSASKWPTYRSELMTKYKGKEIF
ncbi:MAG: transporter substrate-binding protein, partial [Paenibacillus sp.]|nr:transporter substrate-binding protein [Paenibacillus sp.]